MSNTDLVFVDILQQHTEKNCIEKGTVVVNTLNLLVSCVETEVNVKFNHRGVKIFKKLPHKPNKKKCSDLLCRDDDITNI